VTDALNILVVSQSRRRLDDLMAALAGAHPEYRLTGHLDQAIALARWVAECAPDVIIMDLESPSRDTLEQVCEMHEATPRPIVMFSQDGSTETIRSAVAAGVACYVVDGLRAERIRPLLELARTRFEVWQAMREDVVRARQELREHKLVERAKARLMKDLKLSEQAAYNQLRREAMDRRLRLAEVAQRVLDAKG
jgi:response regulator NasT